MKVIIIGASGQIGNAVAELLGPDHEVVRVGHSKGRHTVDLGSIRSIEALFKKVGKCDAVICTAGLSRFAKLTEATEDDFVFSLNHKLMGQVNLVRIAQDYLRSGGSITITTGLLAREPWPGTVPTATVNAGLEGFVRAAALDLEQGVRINAVSPILVTETAENLSLPVGGSMRARETAKAYQVSLEGDMTGQVLDVRDNGSVHP